MSRGEVGAQRLAAEQAVRRGIAWLDKSVADWRSFVDPDTLKMQYSCECVLGQLDGDFYSAVWHKRLSRALVFRRGFAAPPGMPYRTLTAAWRRALKVAK